MWLLAGHCDTVAMSYVLLANKVSIRREDVKSKTVEERWISIIARRS